MSKFWAEFPYRPAGRMIVALCSLTSAMVVIFFFWSALWSYPQITQTLPASRSLPPIHVPALSSSPYIRKPVVLDTITDYYNHDCLPAHLHLSPTSDVVKVGRESRVNMTLSFTLPIDCPHSKKQIRVRYGQDDREYPSIPCKEPPIQFSFANYYWQRFQSPFIYHIILTNLKAGQRDFWYQIEIAKDHNNAVSSYESTQVIHGAQTPPLPTDPVRIALVADWGGTTSDSKATVQGMISRTNNYHHNPKADPIPPLSAVLVAGDLSYANAHLPSWEDWLTLLEPLISKTPLLVAAGNHEIECNRDTFEIFQAYEYYFRNPNRLGPAQIQPIPKQWKDCTHPAEFMTYYQYGNSFYSYQHGMLQIIVLNSYTDSSPGSIQHQWLIQELDRTDRSATPWLMVVFHCPFHTTFRGHNNEDNPRLMMQHLEPLFVKYNVNLVVSGHNHAYVRSYPMVGHDQVDPRGPIYLTLGTGGDSHSKQALHPQPEPWVAHRDRSTFGFVEWVVFNATHAHLERILNDPDEYHPDAADSVWLVQSQEGNTFLQRTSQKV